MAKNVVRDIGRMTYSLPMVKPGWKKSGAGGYAQISDCYVMYLLC